MIQVYEIDGSALRRVSFPNAAALGVAGSVWAVVLSCAASAALA